MGFFSVSIVLNFFYLNMTTCIKTSAVSYVSNKLCLLFCIQSSSFVFFPFDNTITYESGIYNNGCLVTRESNVRISYLEFH